MNRTVGQHRTARAVEHACFEMLEARRMLCVLVSENGAEHVDEHIPASEFVRNHPQFAGKDLWDISTFDPKGTGNVRQFLYDPHMIEDDRPIQQLTPPLQVAPVAALPDIVPLVGGSGGYLQPFIDTTEIPGHALMRFSTAVGNMGAGPISLRSSNTAVDPQGRQIVTQDVYKYDSATNSFAIDYAREAGRFVWHNGHGHFHFEGYARYRLMQNNGGQPGPVVLRSDGSQAVGEKIGFCLINILNTFTRPDNGQSSNTLPGYSGSGQPSNGCGFLQGISVGRADVYDAIYDGQWIDVTGVANGNYLLEVTLDADNVVQETNDNNNTVYVPYTLNINPPTGGIQADRFEPNNTFDTATNLGDLGTQTQPGLTIHITDENDYFKFVATSSGTQSVQLTVGDRDVNLFLYDSNRNLMGQSTSASNGPMTETVNFNFVKGQTYYVLAKGFGSSTGTSGVSSNYALKVNINPTVDASAPVNEASLGNPGSIRILRNGPTSSPLTVNLTYSGTAVPGVDYDALPSSVIIGNEASFADVPVTVRAGANLSTSKTVIANISSNSAYAIGTNGAVVTLVDDAAPANVSQSFAYNASPQGIQFRFSENVQASLAASDLVLTNLTTGLPVPADAVLWDGNTNTATFTFSSPLASASYNAVVAAANVTDPSGHPLTDDAVYNFIWVSGTNASDVVRIDLDPTGNDVRAYSNSASPSFIASMGSLNGLFIAGGDSADTLVVDLVNGIPGAAKFLFDGGSGTDTLAVDGKTGAADQVVFNTNHVLLDGVIEHTAVESMAFDGKGGLDTLVVNAGPTVTLSAAQDLQALNVASGASARLIGGANVAIVTRQLSVLGAGQLDLTDSALVLDYAGLSQLNAMQSLINSGRAGGAWTGGGLISANAKNANPKNTTLAAIEASDFKVLYGPSATFAGVSVDASAILIKYTYYGDADFNGVVNFDDYSRLDNGFSAGATGWLNGDFDGNGVINFDDYSLIDLAFNTQGAPLRSAVLPTTGKGAKRVR